MVEVYHEGYIVALTTFEGELWLPKKVFGEERKIYIYIYDPHFSPVTKHACAQASMAMGKSPATIAIARMKMSRSRKCAEEQEQLLPCSRGDVFPGPRRVVCETESF